MFENFECFEHFVSCPAPFMLKFAVLWFATPFPSGAMMQLSVTEQRNIRTALGRYTPPVAVTDANVQRYALLRRGRPEGRIQRHEVVGVEAAAVRGVSTKVQLFVVPKNRVLPAEIPPQAFVDPDTMEELPTGFNKEQFWLVDCCVDRKQLGCGVFIFESEFKTVSQMRLDEHDQPRLANAASSGGGLPIVDAAPRGDVPAIEDDPNRDSGVATPQPPAAKRSRLERRESDTTSARATMRSLEELSWPFLFEF